MKKLMGILFLASFLYAQESQEVKSPATEEESESLVDYSVEIWIMPNGPQPAASTMALLDEFEAKTGIKTSLVILDWANAWGQINDVLSGSHPPHLIQLGSTWTPYFAKKGYLAPLDEHASLLNFDRFVEVLEGSSKYYGSNEHYGVPWFVDSRALLANRDQLLQAQVDPNSLKTYEGFVEGIKTLQSKKPKNTKGDIADAFAFPGKNDWNITHDISPWVWNEGGELIKQVNGVWQSGLMDATTVKGIRRYIGLAIDGIVPRDRLSMNTTNIADRFNRGQQTLAIKTSETLLQLALPERLGGLAESELAKNGVISLPIPAGTKGSHSFVGGSHLVIPKMYADDPAALELMIFLTQPENLHRYAMTTGFLPSDRKVLTEWSWEPLYTPVVQAVRNGKTHPNIAEWGNLEASLSEMVSSLLSLCEKEGVYTEKAFYDILTRYHQQMNLILGIEKSPVPDFFTFVSYLDPAVQDAAKAHGELKRSYTGWAIAGLIAGILLMIAILAKREHDDQEIEEHADHDLEDAHK